MTRKHQMTMSLRPLPLHVRRPEEMNPWREPLHFRCPEEMKPWREQEVNYDDRVEEVGWSVCESHG